MAEKTAQDPSAVPVFTEVQLYVSLLSCSTWCEGQNGLGSFQGGGVSQIVKPELDNP